MFSNFDRFAMSRALTLAERGMDSTPPNPRVGCVIARGDHIIAEGWHERAGQAHAEVAALHAATEATAGATAYVTLEPCSHHGRTPPCVDALIQARLARVVFAVQDPDPRVSGRGAETLQRAGVTVESGLMEAEATELNIGFMKRMRYGVPWVRVKLAMSLDGRTALASGESKWITSDAARADVQVWRARSSAVMTGVGTVLADDPQLNVRLGGDSRRQPARVVLDSRLLVTPAAKLFESDGDVVIFTAAEAAEAASASGVVNALLECGARIEIVPGVSGQLDLPSVFGRLGELEFNEVLVESGPTLAGVLLSEAFVDEMLIYMAPKLLGPQGRPLINLAELQSLEEAPSFALVDTVRVGDDVRLRLRPR